MSAADPPDLRKCKQPVPVSGTGCFALMLERLQNLGCIRSRLWILMDGYVGVGKALLD